MSKPEYITQAQAAELLGVHEDTVRAAIRRGDLPVVRLGRAVRIPLAEIAKLERRATASA